MRHKMLRAGLFSVPCLGAAVFAMLVVTACGGESRDSSPTSPALVEVGELTAVEVTGAFVEVKALDDGWQAIVFVGGTGPIAMRKFRRFAAALDWIAQETEDW